MHTLILLSPLFILFLLNFLYQIVTTSTVSCTDIHCLNCGYDCTYDQRDNCILDTAQTCLTCAYPWELGIDSCNRSPCNTNACIQCDSSGQYCISCSSLYDLTLHGCQLKAYMAGIIATSILIFIFIVSSITCCYYRKKQREAMLEQMNRNRQNNNPITQLVVASRNSITEQKKVYRLNAKNSQRYIIPDSKNYCSVCLEDNCEVISRCGHLFHAPCLHLWITNKNSCPLCNLLIINIVEVITCLKCRNQLKQYDILQFNKENIYKIEHPQCDNCLVKSNFQKKQNDKQDFSCLQLSASKVPKPT